MSFKVISYQVYKLNDGNYKGLIVLKFDETINDSFVLYAKSFNDIRLKINAALKAITFLEELINRGGL